MGQGTAAYIRTMIAYITRIGEESDETGEFPLAMPLFDDNRSIVADQGNDTGRCVVNMSCVYFL